MLTLMFICLNSQLKLSMNMLVLSLRQQSQIQKGQMLTRGWRLLWRECLTSMSFSLSLYSMIQPFTTLSLPFVYLGVSRMENTNKLWELQSSAEDWTN